jgi:hypothetical protein
VNGKSMARAIEKTSRSLLYYMKKTRVLASFLALNRLAGQSLIGSAGRDVI